MHKVFKYQILCFSLISKILIMSEINLNKPTEQNNNNGNNNSNNFNNNQNNFLPKRKLPNAVAVLVLGICSIFPGCFCAGLVGIVCGIIALVLAKKDLALYNANPNDFDISSYNNLKAGRICGIIGLCLSSLILIIYIIYFAILGAAVSMVPWSAMH